MTRLILLLEHVDYPLPARRVFGRFGFHLRAFVLQKAVPILEETERPPHTAQIPARRYRPHMLPEKPRRSDWRFVPQKQGAPIPRSMVLVHTDAYHPWPGINSQYSCAGFRLFSGPSTLRQCPSRSSFRWELIMTCFIIHNRVTCLNTV